MSPKTLCCGPRAVGPVLWALCHDPPYLSNCPFAWMASVPLASAILCDLTPVLLGDTPHLAFSISLILMIEFNLHFFFSEVIFSWNLAMATLFKTTEYHSMFPFACSTFYFLTCMLFCHGCALYCLPCTFLEMSQDVC